MLHETKGDLPVIPFESAAAWESWLEEHHEITPGIWLKIAKKGTGIDTVTYEEALDVAICCGWIDGQKGSYDEQFWLQRFTPRRPRSKWSKRNVEKATALIEAHRMRPAGMREVQLAREDGRWDVAYESQLTAAVPDDLQQKLDENPAAQAFFAELDSRNRYAILYRIQDAKRPETRARRIDKFVAMLNAGEKLY